MYDGTHGNWPAQPATDQLVVDFLESAARAGRSTLPAPLEDAASGGARRWPLAPIQPKGGGEARAAAVGRLPLVAGRALPPLVDAKVLPPLVNGKLMAPKPMWPRRFAAAFSSPPRGKNTTGAYSLLYPEAERIALADGSRDHLCSALHPGTACTQLTTGGFRYLDFPRLGRCCKCCSYASGSYRCGGPLGPQWLDNATGNLVYMGVAATPHGQCDKWDAQGLRGHHNYYYQFTDRGTPCEVDGLNYLRTPSQPADDLYVFDPASYSTEVALSDFEVPSRCAGAGACRASVCDDDTRHPRNINERVVSHE